MRAVQVRLSGYELLDVKECTIHQAPNEHATAVISGHIREELEEAYLKKSMADEHAELTGLDEEGKQTVLFRGVVKKVSIRNINGAKGIRVVLYSTSFLMDLSSHIRCFQDTGVSYEKILKTIMENYEAPLGTVETDGGKPIGSMLVQYHETDWAFLKRVAGRLGTFVLPNHTAAGTVLSVGVPFYAQSSRIEVLESASCRENDVRYYTLKSRECCRIGEKIEFGGQELYVFQADSALEREELVHTYTLRAKNDFCCKGYANPAITGASLEAYITDVSKDRVKVKAVQDALSAQKKWFPYSTIYSSPDGTGWYCMPEVNDRVRLYFPSEEEEDAYVMSSVHVGGGPSGARSNPDEKSLKSKYGKEILFKPDSLLITNNKGMTIEMNDEDGISIVSDKKISIKSDAAIDITSVNESLQMIAEQEVLLKQNESSIQINEDIVLDGGQVKTV